MCICPHYSVEKIAGSNCYHVLTDEIASELYISLHEFANALRTYLLYFVDGPSKKYNDSGIRPKFAGLPTPNRVYSFNYTQTLEIMQNTNMVYHIHGDTKRNIVLGINPNETDKMESIDTTFLQFKKYYQRAFFNTDYDFLNIMTSEGRRLHDNDTKLYVIGHSLDSTDEDIIKQIFESVKSIIILYHNKTSVKNQIKNIVKMYGKEGFDMLRAKKNLIFSPQGEIQWGN